MRALPQMILDGPGSTRVESLVEVRRQFMPGRASLRSHDHPSDINLPPAADTAVRPPGGHPRPPFPPPRISPRPPGPTQPIALGPDQLRQVVRGRGARPDADAQLGGDLAAPPPFDGREPEGPPPRSADARAHAFA